MRISDWSSDVCSSDLSLLASAEPMFVHTTVLLTNLGVHIKTVRDDVLAWVTTLDDGKVVPQADIRVLNCSGVGFARCPTGAHGIWHHRCQLNAPDNFEDTGLGGSYV